ncbi:MAG: hypothetical protein ACE5K0_12975, partial [Candidatus Methanofastidiosia archaeon]
LILIKERRLMDSLVLLRSFCEMGINIGYIFLDKIDKSEKEIRVLKYMLEGNRAQLKIMVHRNNEYLER